MYLKIRQFIFVSSFFLLSSFQLLAQDIKDITGIITFENKPIQDVNIRILGTNSGTKTRYKRQLHY